MLSEWECRALHSIYTVLLSDFDPKDASIFMESKGVYNEEKAEFIESRPTRLERLREFLRVYKRVASSLEPLVEFFEYTEQEHLTEMIRESLNQSSSTAEPSVTTTKRSVNLEDPKIKQEIRQKLFLGRVPMVRQNIPRKVLIDRLANRLRKNATLDEFLVVVHGCAGSGKSNLVAACLRDNIDLLAVHYTSVIWVKDSCEDPKKLPYLYNDLLLSLEDEVSTVKPSPTLGSEVQTVRQIQDALMDRPNVLIVIDDVILEESVRWIDRLGCRVIVTSRDAEIMQASTLPVDVITVGGMEREESVEMLANRGYPSDVTLTNDVFHATGGHATLISQLALLGQGKMCRVADYCRKLRLHGPLTLSCVSAYEHKSVSLALTHSLTRTPPGLQDALGCASLMPAELWIPAEVWSLVIPVDVCVSSDPLCEVSSQLSRLSRLSWLREQEGGSDYGEFMIPTVIAAYLKETIDAQAIMKLSNAFHAKVTEILLGEDTVVRKFLLHHRNRFEGPTPGGPITHDDDVCKTRALFPINDQCWQKWVGKNSSEFCDVEHFATAKNPKVVENTFTKGHCGCDAESVGDGYKCWTICSDAEEAKLTCPADRNCRTSANSTRPVYCGCPQGLITARAANGDMNCIKPPSPCATCKFNCHATSSCMYDAGSSDQYVCAKCSADLGYKEKFASSGTPGKDCENINECAAGKHTCEQNAVCTDLDPLAKDNVYNYKYKCACKEGWRGNPASTGTTCSPCQDNNECVEQPGICGPNANCTNAPGTYSCACHKGFEMKNGKCENINECVMYTPCGTFTKCIDTIGSYKCECLEKFRPVPGSEPLNCEANPDEWCKNCDKATTDCKLKDGGAQMHCTCKQNHTKVDSSETHCEPIKWCNLKRSECAPDPKGRCVELDPPGSGYKCECNIEQGWTGDGKKCISKDICIRESPCAKSANTYCETRGPLEENDFFCVCNTGFFKQLADRDNKTGRCYDETASPVNNCTICDNSTQVCLPVLDEHNKTYGNMHACYCAVGYKLGGRGKCENINECFENTHDCDPVRAKCLDRTPHLHGGLTYECCCNEGYTGKGTMDSCHDINECEDPESAGTKKCTGDQMVCYNTQGSYECRCNKGYEMIPGVNICKDVDECVSDPCPSLTRCLNTNGSYICVCDNGYTVNGTKNAQGHDMCTDINECNVTELYQDAIPPCNVTRSTCRNTIGSYVCDCNEPFWTADPKRPGKCMDVNECCTTCNSNCQKESTVCVNEEGSHRCDCLPGFEPADERFYCNNIDECARNISECKPNSHCRDTTPFYICECDEGFEVAPGSFDAQRPECKRKSVCKATPEICGCGSCADTAEAPFYECICPSGSFQPNKTMCLTQRYCDDAEYTCPNGKCINNQCVCNEVYVWVNVNPPMTVERVKARKGCIRDKMCEKNACPHPSMTCTEIEESPYTKCECQKGFEVDLKRKMCIDINECKNPTICPENSACSNLNGTYECKCDYGFVNLNLESGPSKWTNPICKNIDECKSAKTHNCTKIPNSICVDKTPGFECVCKTGFAYLRGGVGDCKVNCPAITCDDIDECVNNPCGKNALCKNFPGSYKCYCAEGYKMEGTECVDISNCIHSDYNNCTAYETCVELPGSFRCDCNPGFEKGANGTCIDIVECVDPAICPKEHEECINTIGSYKCVCEDGYAKLNGDTECKAVPVCPQRPCRGNNTVCVEDENAFNRHTCRCKNEMFAFQDECVNLDNRDDCHCIFVPICTSDKNPCKKPHQVCVENTGFAPTCKCQEHYKMNDGGECVEIPVCDDNKCDKKTQLCVRDGPGQSHCECLPTAISYKDKCLENPCDAEGFTCPAGAVKIPQVNATTGIPICRCQCDIDFELIDNKCVPKDQCGCDPDRAPCQNSKFCKEANQTCRVEAEGPKCFCPGGYNMDETTQTCKAIDYCDPNPCYGLACKSLIGRYECGCVRGQEWNTQALQCKDDEDCSEEGYCLGEPHKNCTKIDHDKSYCTCVKPYMGDTPGVICDEPNFCVAYGGSVCDNKTMMSINDMYKGECICKCKNENFTSIFNPTTNKLSECKDINECLTNPCSSYTNEVCVDLPDGKGYECVCRTDYERKQGLCVPVDICERDKVKCPEHSKCDSYTGNCVCDNKMDMVNNTCMCKTDVCSNSLLHNCGSAKCVCSTSFPCFTCTCPDVGEAFEMVLNATTKKYECVDLDQCIKNPCPNGSICVDKIGRYSCECQPPLVQNGVHNCLENTTNCPTCPKNSHCLASTTGDRGAYNCTCDLGYEFDADMKNCIDIDECKNATCAEHAICINKPGTYTCECQHPYSVGNGHVKCEMPNWCETSSDCPYDSTCQSLTEPIQTPSGEKYFTCLCTTLGLKFDQTTRKCEDICECCMNDTRVAECPEKSTCEDVFGGYKCNCDEAGYQWNPTNKSCDDINECVKGTFDKEKCSILVGTCVNTPGSWECGCLVHHAHTDATKQKCERTEYCKDPKLNDCGKHTKCVDLPTGGFKCDCEQGYQYAPQTLNKECTDINECKDDKLNDCGHYENCHNTEGSFFCNCTNGAERGEDNKCAPVSDCEERLECGINGFSRKDKGVCRCMCQDRYIWNDELKVCILLDICNAELTCPINSECVNTQNKDREGGATGKCVCNQGFLMNVTSNLCDKLDICQSRQLDEICGEFAVSCTSDEIKFWEKFDCTCKAGTEVVVTPNGRRCEEPSCEKRNPCDPKTADCVLANNNTTKLCQCKAGYRGVGTVHIPCSAIDACRDDWFPCSTYHKCESVEGKAVCTCKNGYTGNGTYCYDVNECTENTHNCDPHADCTNTQGSFVCRCHENYTDTSDKQGTTCIPTEFCVLKTDKCDRATTTCTDKLPEAGYTCECIPGFQPTSDPTRCENINECLNATVCGEHAITKIAHICEDTVGSYKCICQPGYKLIPGSDKICGNIDECVETVGSCPLNADCTDTIGSYTCKCKPDHKENRTGSAPDQMTCPPIDFCLESRDDCDKATTDCLPNFNIPRRFECPCKEGYERLNDQACKDIDECATWRKKDLPGHCCDNTPGSVTFRCCVGYIRDGEGIYNDIECVPDNVCSHDPAYAKALKIIEEASAAGKSNAEIGALLPNAEKPGSAYEACKGVSEFPMCIDKEHSHDPTKMDKDNMMYPDNFNPNNLTGFTCQCANGVAAKLKDSGAYVCDEYICECKGDYMKKECVNGVRGACVCENGYYLRFDKVKQMPYCSSAECDGSDINDMFSETLGQIVTCNNGSIVTPAGYKVIRDDTSSYKLKVIDIDECVELADPCKCGNKQCTDPGCVRCDNTAGSYNCYVVSSKNATQKDLKCKAQALDADTCKCAQTECNKVEGWFMNCEGCNVTAYSTFKDTKEVCSKIYDYKTGSFITFPNLHKLLDFGCSLYAASADGECGMNMRPGIDIHTLTNHPLFNYLGGCRTDDTVPCETGGELIKVKQVATTPTINKNVNYCKYPTLFTAADSQRPRAGSLKGEAITTSPCFQHNLVAFAFSADLKTYSQARVFAA